MSLMRSHREARQRRIVAPLGPPSCMLRARINQSHGGRTMKTSAALLLVVLVVSAAKPYAHGTEARRVVALAWKKDRITRVLGANRSELGLNGSKAPEQNITVAGRSCLFGDLFAFDI